MCALEKNICFFFLHCLESPYKGILAVSDSHRRESLPGFGFTEEKSLRTSPQ